MYVCVNLTFYLSLSPYWLKNSCLSVKFTTAHVYSRRATSTYIVWHIPLLITQYTHTMCRNWIKHHFLSPQWYAQCDASNTSVVQPAELDAAKALSRHTLMHTLSGRISMSCMNVRLYARLLPSNHRVLVGCLKLVTVRACCGVTSWKYMMYSSMLDQPTALFDI